MAISPDDLSQRLHNAQESLDAELKPWQDPSVDWGKAIIAKACMALRNNNGGILIIGLNDDGSCDDSPKVVDIDAAFTHDAIQEIVSKHSSERFEIVVHLVERGAFKRVMIEIPSGVRTPVISRNNLPKNDTPKGPKGSLLPEGQVFVRTLESNGRPSSSIAAVADWPRLMEYCFNNREADIGAFIRRQLAGVDIGAASSALYEILHAAKRPTVIEELHAYLDHCRARFINFTKEKKSPFPNCGTRECAAIILGKFEPPELSEENMFRFGQIRRHSGWPPFVGLLNIHSGLGTARFADGGWESYENVSNMWKSLDYSRIEPSGRFYYLEALRDDMTTTVSPGKHLEFVIETRRVTETIAAILEFAKEFCGRDSSNDISFAFRWDRLANRILSAWANQNRGFFRKDHPAVDDRIVTQTSMPVSTVPEAIGLHVEAVLKPVFRLFGGWSFQSVVIQDIVKEVLGEQRG